MTQTPRVAPAVATAALLKVLQEAGRPLQIWEITRQANPSIGVSTAYRALRQLKSENKITAKREKNYLLYAATPPSCPPA